MARIDDIPQPTRDAVVGLQMPALPGSPWVSGKPLAHSRVAIVSSAALHARSDMPFPAGTAEFRKLPASIHPADMVMSHISINFDRVGFQRDVNVAYPIDRLRELAGEKVIGSLAPTHYSVMGSTDPATMEATAAGIAASMKAEAVDAALLCPV